MGRLPRQVSSGYLPLFATLLIVAGVIAVAYVASVDFVRVQPVASPPAGSATSTRSLPAFLIVNGQNARSVSGKVETVFSKTKIDSASVFFGRELENGENVYLEADLTTSRDPRSPDGRRVAVQAGRKIDATSSVEIKYNGEARVYVLRLPDGSGVRDAVPIGWFDNETVAINGLATSTRAIYSLSLAGAVREIAQLPAYIENIRVIEGAVWYVSVTPGEGLEQPAMPPAELQRADKNGKIEILARSEADVITDFATGEKNIAYKTEKENKPVPILFLNDEYLLSYGERNYFYRHLKTGEEIESAPYTVGDAVFALPNYQSSP